MPTILTQLLIGAWTRISIFIVASATLWGNLGGGVITQGHIFLDSTNVNCQSIFTSSGTTVRAAHSFCPQVPFVGSGANWFVASWQVPSYYASGAILSSVDLDFGNTQRIFSGSILIQNAARQNLSVGTNLKSFIFASTGAYLRTNSGKILTTKLYPGWWVNAIFSASGSAAATTPRFAGAPNTTMTVTAREKINR